MKLSLTTRHRRKNKTYEYYMPGSWNELSIPQAVKLAELTSSYSKTEALLRFVFWLNNFSVIRQEPVIYSGMNYRYKTKKWRKVVGDDEEIKAARVIRKGFKRFIITDTDLNYITSIVEKWIFNGNEAPTSFLYVSKFKSIPINNDKLNPPCDVLTNCTYEQYTYIDTHFQNFMESKDTADLNMMICAMHQINTEFNSKMYLAYMPVFIDLPFYQKMVYLWFFIGCRKVLSHTFKNLFKESENDTKTKSDPILASIRLTSGMVRIPAHINPTKKELVWDIFSYLDEKIKAFNEAKSKK